MIPKIGPRGETSVDLNVEGPKSIEVQKAGEAATGAVDDEAAFLLPIWDRKFWVMPPGGLTRFLMPARGFINPSATFASNPVIVESG